MSEHNGAAQTLVEQIRAMRQQIPNFVILSPGERQKLASAAAVPPDFVERTIVAVANSQALVRGGATPPEESRDLMRYAEAYGPVADEMQALVDFIRHSVTAARNKAGNNALTTYALAQRLSQRPEHAELAPHVEDMRRALGARGRKRSKAAKPTPKPETPVTQ